MKWQICYRRRFWVTQDCTKGKDDTSNHTTNSQNLHKLRKVSEFKLVCKSPKSITIYLLKIDITYFYRWVCSSSFLTMFTWQASMWQSLTVVTETESFLLCKVTSLRLLRYKIIGIILNGAYIETWCNVYK